MSSHAQLHLPDTQWERITVHIYGINKINSMQFNLIDFSGTIFTRLKATVSRCEDDFLPPANSLQGSVISSTGHLSQALAVFPQNVF